jgi:hypothetical protein
MPRHIVEPSPTPRGQIPLPRLYARDWAVGLQRGAPVLSLRLGNRIVPGTPISLQGETGRLHAGLQVPGVYEIAKWLRLRYGVVPGEEKKPPAQVRAAPGQEQRIA